MLATRGKHSLNRSRHFEGPRLIPVFYTISLRNERAGCVQSNAALSTRRVALLLWTLQMDMMTSRSHFFARATRILRTAFRPAIASFLEEPDIDCVGCCRHIRSGITQSDQQARLPRGGHTRRLGAVSQLELFGFREGERCW